MATELVWYEVIDITSYGLKYPTDWYIRCGNKPKFWENSVCESLGVYSCEEKAINRLKKFATDKGFIYEQYAKRIDNSYPYYENDYEIDCYPLIEIGLWYDIYDQPVEKMFNRAYGTGAMVVKKVITLDKD